MKKALITGITGQDGSYLADFLLSKGYEVHGLIRRSSSFNTKRISHIPIDLLRKEGNFFLHYSDLTDGASINRILKNTKPNEIYNLGAQSHVRVSFDVPEYTADVVGLGSLRLLDAIRETGIKTKFYQASSSEMFGLTPPPQSETTSFHPRSPYACAKVFSYWITKNYREAYGMFAANGILFNHESPRRGENFVTKKITHTVARIKAGLEKKLYLGNLEAVRDWGYAPEYVEAMWLMLQQNKPDDFVIATGEAHTVKEFVEETFRLVGLDWKKYVEIDPRYYRPSETPTLIGDYKKAKRVLKWKPKVKFKELVKIMLEHDLNEHNLKI
ncbi:MAG: GDP-mannose 4,6-dehydratase [bacterium]|nr:GDP-mannose 4,6-dehydratase [bacterium]